MLRFAPVRLGSTARLSSTTWRPQHRKHQSTKSSNAIPASTRRISVVAAALVASVAGIWWSTAARDDVPLLQEKPSDDQNGSDGSKAEVTRMLTQAAYSFKVANVAGVDRYDGAQLASSSPCEDRFTHGRLPSPWKDGKPWVAWAVFDGHAGWQTADLLEMKLIPFVHNSLGDAHSANKDALSAEMIERVIMKAFVDLDDSIVKIIPDLAGSSRPLYEKMKKLAPAFAGSCALLSLYDPVSSRLHVACTGDSRAVLGQQDSDGKWVAVPLSVDQTGSNEEEIARLNKEHPDEVDIAKAGRVLGLAVSRAFGDGRWKWSSDLQTDLARRYHGPSPLTPRYNVLTPPYLTAQPVVTTTTIDSSRPSFLIMGSDGLWDMLSNQQAVDMVATWLRTQIDGPTQSSKKPVPKYEQFDFGEFWKGTPWKFVEERETTQDDNVAVHLLRNSLGGNHHELITGRLAFTAPYSRTLRDDITVQVVFFNMPSLGKR